MRITVLVDNTLACDTLRAEHGLSLHIERADGSRVLLDAGASARFSQNAEDLHVDLSRVDLAILSHHHRDHAGGLDVFFRRNTTAPLYMRPSHGERLFSRRPAGTHEVGLRPVLLRRFSERVVFVEEDEREIAPGLFILTDIPHHHPEPPGNARMLAQHADSDELHLDTFHHELLLVAREPEGLVVFTGCAHHGVLNMLDAVEARFPEEPIAAVVGGFHLIDAAGSDAPAGSPEDLDALGEQLVARQVARYITGHCTGEAAFARLEQHLHGRLSPLGVGRVIVSEEPRIGVFDTRAVPD